MILKQLLTISAAGVSSRVLTIRHQLAATAFDLVDHDLLIKKPEIYKCNHASLQWLKSYLNNREQLVEINGTKSDPLKIKFGVPQGSILGPLLFLVFINDISLEKHLSVINLFADNAVASAENKSKHEIIDQLQNCANSLDKWCISNKMVLSIEKTKTLFISNSQPNSHQKTNNHFENVKISNTMIDEVDSTKLLGVNVDKTVSWCMHVAQVKKCTSYRLFIS